MIKIATITQKTRFERYKILSTYNMFGNVLVKFGDDCLSLASSSSLLPLPINVSRIYFYFYLFKFSVMDKFSYLQFSRKCTAVSGGGNNNISS